MIKITDKSECNGCYACKNVCPKNCILMNCDSEGFWYPTIEENRCIKCELCIKVCPVLNDKHNQVRTQPKAFAAYNKNEKIREESSSGGVFTIIAEYVLNQNGVVFGACFDNEFNVVHSYIEDKKELNRFRGSKYVQSKIGDTYKQVKEFLVSGKVVLFTGTPCQVGGLLSYLGKEYSNLITHDIICHGVPSPKVWKKYIEFREKIADSQTKQISFRSKVVGWKRFSMLFSFKNDKEYYQIIGNDFYMKAFLKDGCSRPSCYNCSFKNINRQADITLADFWGIQYINPKMDDDKGTSLLIINSDKGNRIFEEIEHLLVWEEAELNKAIEHNPSMIKSVVTNDKRKLFIKDLDNMEFDQAVNKYYSDPFQIRCKVYIYSIIQTIFGKKTVDKIMNKIRKI